MHVTRSVPSYYKALQVFHMENLNDNCHSYLGPPASRAPCTEGSSYNCDSDHPFSSASTGFQIRVLITSVCVL